MTNKIKTDIFSGFLGAGKTTLIKKLIRESYAGEKVVLIENEFGEIGIDGGFLADAGVTVNEMNSGCICCSLVGDFGKALTRVIEEYAPQRIIIEPSGVGKLSDIIRAVENVQDERLMLNGFVAVADAKKCKMYMRNFGEFFNDQIEHASAIILSHTAGLSQSKIDETVALLREHNPEAVIVSTDWDALSGNDILAAMERRDTMDEMLKKLAEETGHAHHHHHEDEDGHHHHHHEEGECEDENCSCHHHHEEEEEHHHHHHEEGECEDENCSCHHHHEDEDGHHHHHHADEVFTSCGFETTHSFAPEDLTAILEALSKEETYGLVLRAKGIVAPKDGGEWIHFDYVPGEPDIRRGPAGVIGRICVIGAGIHEDAIRTLLGL